MNKAKSKSNSSQKIETVRGAKYIVKSVYVGNKGIDEVLMNLAQRKAFEEMGLDMGFGLNSEITNNFFSLLTSKT